jgi:outer membrane protein OmpA-like peptidoglycan-associated protein
MKNFGEPINTDGDESSPYMPNDSTLYFSSKGNSSIGGYDVFVSHKRNGEWAEPENLNMPINTPYDEINYRISNDRKFAYYASDRNEGYGKFDIYKITKGFDVVVDEEILAQFNGVDEDSLPTKTFLNEAALGYENSVSGSNSTTDKLVAQGGGAKIDAGDSQTLADLTNNKNLTVEKTSSNTISVSENFDDNPIRLSDFNQKALESSIKFNIPNSVQYRDDYSNSFIFEKVAHFGFASTMLTEYSKKVIQPVIDFINDNPSKQFTIRLYGHTDSKGSPKQNMVISTERVNNVKAYLESMGVKANMETKSFGESRPATASENEQNAVFNRREQVRVYVK